MTRTMTALINPSPSSRTRRQRQVGRVVCSIAAARPVRTRVSPPLVRLLQLARVKRVLAGPPRDYSDGFGLETLLSKYVDTHAAQLRELVGPHDPTFILEEILMLAEFSQVGEPLVGGPGGPGRRLAFPCAQEAVTTPSGGMERALYSRTAAAALPVGAGVRAAPRLAAAAGRRDPRGPSRGGLGQADEPLLLGHHRRPHQGPPREFLFAKQSKWMGDEPVLLSL